MNSFFYAKLAATNLKKNSRTYVPYILTCICSISMYYIMYSLAQNPASGNGSVQFVLSLGTWVIGIFSVIFLFYTNSFLMKRRKKELGLFNILGMEKKHISKIIACETLYTFGISIVLGLITGMVFSKLVNLILLKLLQFDFKYGFEISVEAIGSTLLLFGIIFSLILGASLLQIAISRPIQLLKGGQTGEREPKTKWIMAFLGLACLAIAYWISVATEDPMAVILLFFVAVILVIIGTYFLFIAGGVLLLKILRKNKRYYYQANHFISVSGLMYRMKQNAAGLATICILSTMVLVMISSTTALYAGMEDSLEARYPKEISVTLYEYTDEAKQLFHSELDRILENYDLILENLTEYRYLSIAGRQSGSIFSLEDLDYYDSSLTNLCFIPGEDFSTFLGVEIDLGPDEVLLYSNRAAYGRDIITIDGKTLKVKENIGRFQGFKINGSYNADISGTYYLIVPDLNDYLPMVAAYSDEGQASLRYHLDFDFQGESAEKIAFYDEYRQSLRDKQDFESGYYLESRESSRSNFLWLYGGLFFLGLFLGLLFMMATVLIIYYKQISEGYDDKERFAIMQKVGLSKKEAKRSIHSQILTMFFLPLIMACIHLFFAFPAITRLLAMLNLMNVKLFLVTTLISILVFTVFYVIVYGLTAKVYYKIVDGR